MADNQRTNLMRPIFTLYQEHWGLFWRVMMPCVLILLVVTGIYILYLGNSNPDASWGFDTANGVSPKTTSKLENGIWGVSAHFRLFQGETVNGVTQGWVLNISWLSLGFLWAAMCPLILVIVSQRRGGHITVQEAWRQTLRKIWTLLGVYLLLLLGIFLGVFVFIVLPLQFGPALDGPLATILLMTLLSTPITYFMVICSLHNQCIILEDLPIIASFRRSYKLIRGRWLKAFGMYFVLTLGSSIFTAVLCGLIGLFLSSIVPEFMLVGEELESERFFRLFIGGYVGVTLENAPSLWTVYLIEAVKVLITAFFLPIWAILTTRLYLERRNTTKEAV